MANLTTTADIKAAVLQHAGELTNGNSPFDSLVVTYINRIYNEVVSGGTTFIPDLGEPWEWARAAAPGVLALKAPYTTGTVSLTLGSASGTFNTAPGAGLGSFAGRMLRITDRPEFFRVVAHTAGAGAFVLDAAYTDETGAALGFAAHKLDYDLASGIARLIEPMRTYRVQRIDSTENGKIYGVSSDILGREYPLTLLESGTPTHFALIKETNGVPTVRFNRSVPTETRVEYEYVATPVDLTASPDTTPILPRDDRPVLVYGATYFLMVDKEDSRADAFFRMCQAKLQAMILERRRRYSQTSGAYGRLIARADQVADRVVRSASGSVFP